ncbi:MAG TPA: hypothetical protein DIS74_06345 [Bacteroidales bacterium]|nr:hypothetical protein [Bacteroidales bacterium]
MKMMLFLLSAVSVLSLQAMLAQQSDPVQLMDKADEYGFSRKVTYLETGSLKTKKIDFYNLDNELFKTIEIVATQPIAGKEGYVMTDMVATNHLNGRSSRVKFDQVNTSATIADNTFSVESLTR